MKSHIQKKWQSKEKSLQHRKLWEVLLTYHQAAGHNEQNTGPNDIQFFSVIMINSNNIAILYNQEPKFQLATRMTRPTYVHCTFTAIGLLWCRG